MYILFVHQNYPAQFGQIAERIARLPGYRCTFVSRNPPNPAASAELVQYRTRGGATKHNHPCSRSFENAVHHTLGVYAALKARPDIHPDIVVGHSGFGSTLYLRELYPDTPIVNYFEYFYHISGGDIDFRPEFPSTELARLRARSRNATILLDLETCDAGYSPTDWQRSRLPVEFRPKVSVIHDGIDTDFWKPTEIDRAGPRQLGDLTVPEGTKLVTYVSRGFESMRGFDVFMAVAKRICDRRGDVVFAVVGEDRICYGGDKQFTGGKSFKDWVLSRDEYNLSRIRFLGRLQPSQLSRLLGISDLHIYLTTPFVLSWSMLNAMSCGAVVLASDTPPVREAIRNGENGLLADFHDLHRWEQLANQVLDDPAEFRPLGAAAREVVRERYDVGVCLPKMLTLFSSVTSKRPAVEPGPPALPPPRALMNGNRARSLSDPPIVPTINGSATTRGNKCVLHVGCGPKRRDKLHASFHTDEWREIRVDIDPAVKPDIVASIASMPQISSASVDAVWSSHNLEHLHSHEVPAALREFLRVLKPGGFVLLTLPDLQKAAEFLARGQFDEPVYQSPAGPISALDICFGHRKSVARGNGHMAHRTGFSAQSLGQKLSRNGFESVRVVRKGFNLWATAHKPKAEITSAQWDGSGASLTGRK